MKKNPALTARPNCGHYAACATRMIEIKTFSKFLFIYTMLSGFALISLIGLNSISGLNSYVNLSIAGAFSFLPMLFAEPDSMALFYLHILEIIILMVMGILTLTKFKLSSVIIFGILTISFFGSIFTEQVNFFSVGTLFCAVGIALSFRSIGVYLDYNQLCETEGFPYFSELFEIPETSGYQSLYKEQFKKLPKNPERHFGDIAPIPLKPEHQMTDLADTPMQAGLLKPENHRNDEDMKNLFEEV